MLELYNGPLNVEKIFSSWQEWQREKNFGAFITFVGTVRDENNIEALSFDLYEPILKSWFKEWQERANQKNAFLKMAHSIGDVPVHSSSFMAGVFSPKRRVALSLIDEFVEDFKANAPIWKYDVINKKRVYAKDRSQRLKGSGILGDKSDKF